VYWLRSDGSGEAQRLTQLGPGRRWQISTGGVNLPVWSHDGRELLFETLDQRVMAVSYADKGDSIRGGEASTVGGDHLRSFGVLGGNPEVLSHDFPLAKRGFPPKCKREAPRYGVRGSLPVPPESRLLILWKRLR